MVKLGDKVKDVISGATGIVTSRTEYVTGCVRVGICIGFSTEKGEELNYWTDEERCKVLQSNSYHKPQQRTAAAGPQPNPQRTIDPK
jgi:hypothetical protein